MRSLARCATLGLSMALVGCGATNEGAPVATTPGPPPVATAPPATATAEAASGCISREARAAVETCPGKRVRQPARKNAWAIAGSAPAPLDPKKTAGRPPAPDPCGRQSRITEATLAQNPGRKDEAMRALEKQLEVYRGFVAEARDPAQKLACAAKTAQLMTETAMAWHLEAVGAGGVRGTADAKTIELAARLYELVVKTFTQEDFARFDFPRFAREDWPTISKVRYALADLLYFIKDWKRCGPAFDAVVAEDPDGPQAAEASYASVLCYQNVYTEAHPPGNGERADAKNPVPPGLTEAQKAMLAAFGRYVCFLSPAASEKDAYSTYVEVKYARARLYFEAERWEEAAVAFREIAMSHADAEVGIYAAQLYLEALNKLGSAVQPPRPVCYDDLAADLPKLVELYCTGGREKQNAEACDLLHRIQRDIDRLHAAGR